MNDIWFTADTHFYHGNVIKYCGRPFEDVDQMNEALIANWNSVVKPADMVYHLGDVGFCNITKLIALRGRLNGHIKLILGNHDYGIKKMRWLNEVKINEVLCDIVDISYESTIVTLSHYPYLDDKDEICRYADRRPKDRGGWLLCGHIHEKWRIKDKQFNVGVDVNNYTPINLKQIIQEIKQNA